MFENERDIGKSEVCKCPDPWLLCLHCLNIIKIYFAASYYLYARPKDVINLNYDAQLLKANKMFILCEYLSCLFLYVLFA